jgi:PTS system nitrogen regulatory IIA component
MDRVSQRLCPQQVQLDLDVPGRWEALQAVSTMIERSQRLSGPVVCRALWRRELAASTALGNGFAVPHARITGITEPVTVYARTKAPVDFAAPDGKRVSELFVILVPADGPNAEHLQLLSRVAELFSDTDFRARLVAASTPHGVRSAFAEWIDQRHLGARLSEGRKRSFGHTLSQFRAARGPGRPHHAYAGKIKGTPRTTKSIPT